jgi:hypothetical protein
MEEKINIAEILKDKPVNTKLYSPLFSEVFFSHVSGGYIAVEHHGSTSLFLSSGKFYDYDGAEPLLFPSKEMRDWSKFAWKKGDILVNKDAEVHIIFDGFKDDTYKTFHGHYYLWEEEGSIVNFEENEDYMQTSEFYKANKEEAQTYINTIEERLGGKLNRETLEIEKAQPEFKDWDFITIKLPRGSSLICVFKAENDENYYLHASLDSRGMITINENSYCSKSGCIVRLSTEEEKTAFFDALARKGKIWEVEKKKIIALKKKWTPKPFDRVITRNADDDIWTANIFSHMDSHGEYVTIGCVGGYTYCIPYNEETAKLIGTTNNVEG